MIWFDSFGVWRRIEAAERGNKMRGGDPQISSVRLSDRFDRNDRRSRISKNLRHRRNLRISDLGFLCVMFWHSTRMLCGSRSAMARLGLNPRPAPLTARPVVPTANEKLEGRANRGRA